jgi:putative DNA primase/helicase
MSIAARIAERLGGKSVKARSNGNYLVPCPAHEDANPSLSLRDGDRGLIVHCFVGCSPGDIYAAIRRVDRGLLQPGQTAREPVKRSSEYERRQHEKASYLWSQRRRITGGIAERYLRDVRGITCTLPATLAFLPPLKPEHAPAMIAAFTLVDEVEPGALAAPSASDVGSVHLTPLKPDGSGKAEGNKLIIGSPTVKIDNAGFGLPIVIAPPNDLLGMAVTEGIEDGLTVCQTTGLGVWCAGSATMMPKLAKLIPGYIEAVTIFAHADQAGRAGAHDLARALHRRNSIEVRLEGLS